MKTGISNVTKGQLLSFREINCFLPKILIAVNGNLSEHSGKPTAAFYIKAANDGIKFSSQEVVIIIYDSKCIECTKKGTRTCRLKVMSFTFKLLSRMLTPFHCYITFEKSLMFPYC